MKYLIPLSLLLLVFIHEATPKSPVGPLARLEEQARKKRTIILTPDRRLALPPGATLIITPTLSLPFIRGLPTGYASNITFSLPFTVFFEKLGLTSDANPWGLFPNLGYVFSNIGKRSVPSVSEVHGGDRRLLYQVVEDLLSGFGMDGKACLLRTICEIHEVPLLNHGMVGEMLELFLTASRGPYAEHRLTDYVAAEHHGRSKACTKYFRDCPKSLFFSEENIYSQESNNLDDDELVELHRNPEMDLKNRFNYDPK